MHYYFYTSLLPQWKIPVSLQLDCHICNLQKKTKRDLSLFYCLSDFIVILLFGIFLGVYILNRSRSFQIHISGTSFTSRWDHDLVPAKLMGLDRSILYLFLFHLFLFLAHVQKMVYQSITYIIVPVPAVPPAHCTPTFYGIMDTMCVCVSAPATFAYVWHGLYVSKCGCQYFWWLPHLAIGADSAKTIQVWDHPKVLPLVMGIDHCLFDPISSNILPWLIWTMTFCVTHLANICTYQKSFSTFATEISMFHKSIAPWRLHRGARRAQRAARHAEICASFLDLGMGGIRPGMSDR